MIDPVVERKFSSLQRCLTRLKEKRPATLAMIQGDYDLQDILSVNLERAVQLSVDVAAYIISEKNLRSTSTMAGAFDALCTEGIISSELADNLQRSVGFRNVAVHEYTEVDWKILLDVLHNHLHTFSDFMKVIYHYYE
ncbi:MAG: DUF86 domain-containing protein [Sphaerochaetaceae bacterium]|nr:DUF86 domain-containing protein [Sphaerochaetaceae bacterium]